MSSKNTVVSFAVVASLCATALHGCTSRGALPDSGEDAFIARDVPPDLARDSGVDAPQMQPDVPMDVPVLDTGGDVTVTDTVTDVPPVDVVNPVDAGDAGACYVSSTVATHSAMMATMGWASRNLAAGMLMYGCAPGSAPSACLSTMPLADDTNIGALASAIPTGHLRVLYRSTDSSSWWTRISPDGRFAARGTHLHDFVRGAEVQASACCDPAFFPDNSRFMYAGGISCPVSVLTTGMPTDVMFSEPGCNSLGGLGVYEHLAVALDGTDYWATSAGSSAFDDGGHAATLADPAFSWTDGAQTPLSLMANTGTTFDLVSTVSMPTPYQGNAVISPSSTLLISQLADSSGSTQIAYALYQLTATRVGSAVTSSLSEIARYCMVGTKPVFSLDERYFATHHYVTAADAMDLGFTGPADPHFAPYLTQGAANIYVVNLATGVRTRVTNMAPGRYALFPSFRSDGWMYFTVRTAGTQPEYIVASDATIVLP